MNCSVCGVGPCPCPDVHPGAAGLCTDTPTRPGAVPFEIGESPANYIRDNICYSPDKEKSAEADAQQLLRHLIFTAKERARELQALLDCLPRKMPHMADRALKRLIDAACMEECK